MWLFLGFLLASEEGRMGTRTSGKRRTHVPGGAPFATLPPQITCFQAGYSTLSLVCFSRFPRV